MERKKTIMISVLAVFMLAAAGFIAIQQTSDEAQDDTGMQTLGANATDLISTINGITGLTAVPDVASPNTAVVTVTGTATKDTATTLNIPAGVTVKWQASLTGTNSAQILRIEGGTGVLEVVAGGKIEQTSVNEDNGVAISNMSTGTVSVAGGEVTSNGWATITNMSSGTISVSGGKVSAATGTAILNNSTGTVNVSGGEVSTISNYAIITYTGAVNVSGGKVNATTGTAILNDSTALVKISGTAMITSANTNATRGTIILGDEGTSTELRLYIEGGTVENTSSGNAIYNRSVGAISISGGEVIATTGAAVYNNSTGTVNVSGTGEVSVTSGHAINNNSTGTINISGGEVIAKAGVGILNGSTGTINISGGEVNVTGGYGIGNNSGTLNISGGIVSATNGHAVANSTGAVNISAGTVSAESGIAISNSSTGQITISGTAEITSANTDIESGTIFLASSGTATAVRLSIIGGTVENKAAGNAIRNNSTGAVNISDGTVKNTSTGAAIRNGSSGILNISGGTISATTGMAAINNSTGTINVSGGTVSATTGTAIYINTTGLVTVSGTAKITSANTNSGLGTIFLRNQMADTGARLEIKGGTVENRSSGNAIRNDSTGAINISGGTFPVTTGKPIDNASTGAVNISPAVVSVASKMVTKEGQISVNVTGMAGTTTFQWYKDGVAITGATSRTLDVKEIDDNGTYVCKVQNVVGEFSSAEVSSEAITVTIEEGDNNTILMIGAVIAIIAIGGLAVYWFVLRKK